MATISDVARAAGVPVATGSHVITQMRPAMRREALARVDGLAQRCAEAGTIGVMVAKRIARETVALLRKGAPVRWATLSEPIVRAFCGAGRFPLRRRAA